MKVKDAQFFTVVSSFLNVYLVKNRSCSSNTVKSYEDALNLLFTFFEGTKDIPRQRVSWSHFTRQNIQEFVDWLEKVRNCSRQTQLQRLAAIRSFVRYGGIVDLRVIAIQADVERIRYRKPPPALVGYLTKEELSIFLAQPNCKKRTGFRNMVFLVLMYDTAARCQEMLDLRIQDLVLHRTSPCVYFTGKGNKTRVVPILPKTAEHLRSYLKKFHPAENRKRDDYVFYAYGGPQRPMSPDTVAAFVKKYGESARHVCTSIPERVHPHMLRHTRAMHLYQGGVPLAMVSEFLGHAQIETTKIYAHADTEMKRKAIQQAANKLNDTIPDALWNTDDEEMMLKLRGKQQSAWPPPAARSTAPTGRAPSPSPQSKENCHAAQSKAGHCGLPEAEKGHQGGHHRHPLRVSRGGGLSAGLLPGAAEKEAPARRNGGVQPPHPQWKGV